MGHDQQAKPLQGAPLPRDEERFRYLSPDKPAILPPGFKLPSPEELAKRGLDRWLAMQGTYDGN